MRLLRSVERRHEPLSMEAGKMKNNQQSGYFLMMKMARETEEIADSLVTGNRVMKVFQGEGSKDG